MLEQWEEWSARVVDAVLSTQRGRTAGAGLGGPGQQRAQGCLESEEEEGSEESEEEEDGGGSDVSGVGWQAGRRCRVCQSGPWVCARPVSHYGPCTLGVCTTVQGIVVPESLV